MAATLIWIKVVKPKTPLNYQKIAKDKFWLILTGLTIVGVAYLYFYLPQVFKWLAVDIWGVPASSVGEDKKTVALQLTDLGPLGDIYGSLNTLFTSATLAFVVYATLLQRQANKDAREAMLVQLKQAKQASSQQLKQAQDTTQKQLKQARRALQLQLKQTRDATAKQLKQARESTALQIEQAKRSATDQLALAKSSHAAQILESKHAILSNTFNTFLNQKKILIDNINVRNPRYKSQQVFVILCQDFESKIKNQWKNLVPNPDECDETILIEFRSTLVKKDLNSSFSFNEIVSYFYMYVSILSLIKDSTLDEIEKYRYYNILSHSMTHEEQVTLLWYLGFSGDLRKAIRGTNLIDTSFSEDSMSFLIRHYEKSFFGHPDLLENWDRSANKETTPA